MLESSPKVDPLMLKPSGSLKAVEFTKWIIRLIDKNLHPVIIRRVYEGDFIVEESEVRR